MLLVNFLLLWETLVDLSKLSRNLLYRRRQNCINARTAHEKPNDDIDIWILPKMVHIYVHTNAFLKICNYIRQLESYRERQNLTQTHARVMIGDCMLQHRRWSTDRSSGRLLRQWLTNRETICLSSADSVIGKLLFTMNCLWIASLAQFIRSAAVS